MATTTARLGLTKPASTDTVDISVLDTNLDQIDLKMCSQVCTSGTRPSSPFQGQLIYEADTGLVRVYTGAAWVSVPASGVAVTSSTRPGSPTAGQVIYETDTKLSFVWNGTAWVVLPAGAFACTSSTHPSDPATGQLAYETDTGATLVYSGSAWVPVLNTSAPTVVGATGSTAAVRVQTTGTLNNRGVGLRKQGDAQDAFTIDFSGKHQFGAGGASAPDATFYRSAASTLTTDGNFVVGGTPSVVAPVQAALYNSSGYVFGDGGAGVVTQPSTAGAPYTGRNGIDRTGTASFNLANSPSVTVYQEVAFAGVENPNRQYVFRGKVRMAQSATGINIVTLNVRKSPGTGTVLATFNITMNTSASSGIDYPFEMPYWPNPVGFATALTNYYLDLSRVQGTATIAVSRDNTATFENYIQMADVGLYST